MRADRRPLSLLRLLEHPAEARAVGRFRLGAIVDDDDLVPRCVARDPARSSDVILQLSSFDPLDEPVADKRRRRDAMLAEGRKLCALDHRDLVAPTELVVDEAAAILALVFARDESTPFLRHPVPVAPGAIADILRMIASALAAMHAARLVHRCIAPHRIAPRTGGRVALLGLRLASADIAVQPGGARAKEILRIVAPDRIGEELDAVLADEVGVGPRARRAPNAFGALGYVDPARMNDGGPADVASDLYALGATVYALATGAPPAAITAREGGAVKIVEVDRAILFGDAPARPLRQLVPAVPEAVAALIDRLLQRDPALRPARASDVFRSIEAGAATLPASEGAPSRDAVDVSSAPSLDDAPLEDHRKAAVVGAARAPGGATNERAAKQRRGLSSKSMKTAFAATLAFAAALGIALLVLSRAAPPSSTSTVLAASSTASVAPAVARALALIRAGQAASALAILDPLARANPREVTVLRGETLAHAAAHDDPAALDSLKALYAVSPSLPIDAEVGGVVGELLGDVATRDAMLSLLGGAMHRVGGAMLVDLAYGARDPDLAAPAASVLARDEVQSSLSPAILAAVDLRRATDCSVRRAILGSYRADFDARGLAAIEALSNACSHPRAEGCACLRDGDLLTKVLGEVRARLAVGAATSSPSASSGSKP